MNGQAECMIGLVKRSIVSTLENRPCTFNELLTVLAEVALIVNSRPVGVAGRVEDTEAGMAVTTPPSHVGESDSRGPRNPPGGARHHRGPPAVPGGVAAELLEQVAGGCLPGP